MYIAPTFQSKGYQFANCHPRHVTNFSPADGDLKQRIYSFILPDSPTPWPCLPFFRTTNFKFKLKPHVPHDRTSICRWAC